ncbi:uncharacterized protein (UPF0548 family) [Microterricola gilva]|uniref:Uncharacterized protein (UPF0548 family) n=1 Tax=Microterricola gilva TaxID=393267 RepID=A0A4Q8ALJ4_9MICO|nr:DUF1990 domain-containing protein [Microterricola gilva]RZU65440.1 uncharacterized protein (UPF0548 family) [Microterricola gilva]
MRRPALADQPLSYGPVGGTLAPTLLASPPDGYRATESSVRLGSGAERFAAASVELMHWQVLRRSGIAVADAAGAGAREVTLGDTVVQSLPLAGLRFAAPIRVVRVLQEPRRVGYAAGTLPGHPLRGEELFLIEHRADDSVWLVIRAFAQPATLLYRIGSPAIRFARRRYTARFLRALLEEERAS